MTIGPRFGASIALARRDKELYVTQILHLRGLPLSLSPRISVSTELKCSKPPNVSPAFTTRLSLVLMDDSRNNGTRWRRWIGAEERLKVEQLLEQLRGEIRKIMSIMLARKLIIFSHKVLKDECGGRVFLFSVLCFCFLFFRRGES